MLLIWGLLFVLLPASSHQFSSDYVITLNQTDNATIYCYSDYLRKLRLETVECVECKRRTFSDPDCGVTVGRPKYCTCKEECAARNERCPGTPAEHSTCVAEVQSRNSSRGLVCTGFLNNGGNLTIDITIVRHTGNELCYGPDSGTPTNLTLQSDIQQLRDIAVPVSYKSRVYCINISSVDTLHAGHLLGVGYTLPRPQSVVVDHDRKFHEDDRPLFERFCKLDRPHLWRVKQGYSAGTVFQCNGTYHVLQDSFPCLQFPPTGGFRLPSLDNCSPWQMVGIVVAMIVAMVLCYTVLIACVRLWSYVCHRATVDKEDIPLALADSSTNSRTTLAGSAVVKQESRDSVLSGVTLPPAPPPPPQCETREETTDMVTENHTKDASTDTYPSFQDTPVPLTPVSEDGPLHEDDSESPA